MPFPNPSDILWADPPVPVPDPTRRPVTCPRCQGHAAQLQRGDKRLIWRCLTCEQLFQTINWENSQLTRDVPCV